LERVQLAQPVPSGRRLLVRLCLFAFCGGLLLLLSSRPAEAAERREPGLLGPVRTTLKATAREVDSFAGRATGSRSSTVDQAGAARPAVPSTVQRGAPAVTSPVRRAAPPTSSTRRTARSTGTAAKPVTRTLTGPVERVARLAAGPALAPVEAALDLVGPAIVPVGAVLAPVTGPVAGLVPPVVPVGLLPVPGPTGPGTAVPAGSGSKGPAAAGPVLAASQTHPARPAADGASSPATRSTRS
jgi:hypothetical protein